MDRNAIVASFSSSKTCNRQAPLSHGTHHLRHSDHNSISQQLTTPSGAGNLVLHYHQELSRNPSAKPIHFYSSSGGNAGLATVTAARSLNYPATVVVPNTTKPLMIAKLRAAGATDVLQTGDSWQQADDHLRHTILPSRKHETGIYVPPFDHEQIWEGVSTLIPELQTQLPNSSSEPPDAIICSVGGGGLFCGLMLGLSRLPPPWPTIPVLAMETHGADSLAQSLQAGHLITLPGITSIATSLGAVRVAEKTFEYGQQGNVKSVVLEDAEAAMGQWRLADDERMLVDTACSVSVAVCYDGRLKRLVPGLGPDSKVVIVVCGGSAVTVEEVIRYKEKYGARMGVEGKGEGDGEVPSSHTMPRKGDEEEVTRSHSK
ncbi:MAG: hypothetical protein Q9227_003235 [Pyrenula ochraceoflavens]